MDTMYLMYYLKEGWVGPPKIYLGAKIKKYQIRSGKSHWITSNTQYVKNAIKTVEGTLKDDARKLIKVNSYVNNPFSKIYHPELEHID